jgi:hypothetical protein
MIGRSLDSTSKGNHLNNQRNPRSLLCLVIPKIIQIGQVSEARTVVLRVQLCPTEAERVPKVNIQFE